MKNEKARDALCLKNTPSVFCNKNAEFRDKLKIFVNFVILMVRLGLKK
jgi:hypothetical protein